MFTGQIVADHGYKEDKDHGGRLADLDGRPYENIFDLVKARDGSTAFYGSKDKFAIFNRSWNIDVFEYQKRGKVLVPMFLEDMNSRAYTFAFLHVRNPDRAGHGDVGADSDSYRSAVADADRYLGQIFDLIENNSKLRGRTAIVMTADHGFADIGNHADEELIQNYRIPFCAYGPGVRAGADLVDLNSSQNGGTVLDPRESRGGEYDRIIRNSYAGVLAADFLGIKPSNGAFSEQYLAVGDRPSESTVIEASSGEIVEEPEQPTPVIEEEEDEEEEETWGLSADEEPTGTATTPIVQEEDENQGPWDISGTTAEQQQPVDQGTNANDGTDFTWEDWLIERPDAGALTGQVGVSEEQVQVQGEQKPPATIVSSEEVLDLFASEYTSINPRSYTHYLNTITIGEDTDALIRFQVPNVLEGSTIDSTVLELRVLEGDDSFEDSAVYQTAGDWVNRYVSWEKAPDVDGELGKLASIEDMSGYMATVELDGLKVMNGHILLRIAAKEKDTVVFDPESAKLSFRYRK